MGLVGRNWKLDGFETRERHRLSKQSNQCLKTRKDGEDFCHNDEADMIDNLNQSRVLFVHTNQHSPRPHPPLQELKIPDPTRLTIPKPQINTYK